MNENAEQDRSPGLEGATDQAEQLGSVVRRLEEIRQVARYAKDEMTLVDIAHIVSGARDLADRIVDREHGTLAYLSPYAPPAQEDKPAPELSDALDILRAVDARLDMEAEEVGGDYILSALHPDIKTLLAPKDAP